jgi:excisionase family DNA binding protein
MPKQISHKVSNAAPPSVGALKIKAAAKYLGGVSPITIRRLIDRGKIVPCRHLRHLLIPICELDRWLEEG